MASYLDISNYHLIKKQTGQIKTKKTHERGLHLYPTHKRKKKTKQMKRVFTLRTLKLFS